MIYPRLNQSLKWKKDYIFLKGKNKKMEESIEKDLDMLDDLKNSFPYLFLVYVTSYKQLRLKNPSLF